jgi:hypothetical protein
MTHSCACDLICDLSEEGLVLFGILASYKHFECDLSAFQWLQMFCCDELGLEPLSAPSAE